MSALAHYLEHEGLATVAIALVREHAERIRPPRALWVPFELGRPLGPPSDAPFQRRVLTMALERLVAVESHSTIVDFPDDDPRERPDPNWAAPFAAAPSVLAAATPAEAAAWLGEEIDRLAPWHARAVAKNQRTTVGLTGLPIRYVGDYLSGVLRGHPIVNPVPSMSAPLAFRFAADDLKAFHLETALGVPGRPSSRQLLDWFWGRTWAGRALLALRTQLLTSSDDRLVTVADRFLVPRARLMPIA